EHHLGVELLDQRHRRGNGAGLADDVHRVAELRAHAREEEVMVVDENDAALHGALLVMCSSTSVPSPGLVTTVAFPPARSSRPSIDSTRPRRSAGTAARSKPPPRSRTKTETSSSVTSA